jgi:hypothetical protein
LGGPGPEKGLCICGVFRRRLHYGLDCGVRHQTLLCTISAGGDAYCPLLAGSDRRAREVFRTGIREKTDLWILVKDSPYVDRDVFEAYIEQKVIPHIQHDRQVRALRIDRDCRFPITVESIAYPGCLGASHNSGFS